MIEPAGSSANPVGAYHAIFGILLLIAAAIAAAGIVRWKKALPAPLRALIYTYSEFVVLGFAIGPHGLGLINDEVLGSLDPFLHLSLGGVGLIYGAQFKFAQLKRFKPEMFKLAFFQAAFTFVFCAAVFFAFSLALGFGPGDAVFLATALGVIASVSAPHIIAQLIQEQQTRGENAHLLQFVTALDGMFGIVLLALLIGDRPALTGRILFDAPIWLAFSALIGFSCGLVFQWLTEGRASREEMLLYLAGLVIFGSGVAATLHLSPLFVNIVFGLTVANISRRVEEIFARMGRIERPLFIVLLILVGARWQFTGIWVAPFIFAYLLFRFLGKWGGCLLGGRLFRLYFEPAGNLGLGLMAQGGLALAMLINLALIESNGLLPLVETVVIISIAANEFLSPPLIRYVLARSGEWRASL